MFEVSVGCVNDGTYGVSCVKCKKCGRKFTEYGIDDSEVVDKRVKEYQNFLESDLWKQTEIQLNLK